MEMESTSRGEDHYYEKITSIQQNMHKREKRRLELERKLFSSSRSDNKVSQIKHSRLRSYLKEICDREARAKMRNLELLRDVECIEISMKEYSPPDRGPLQQQKADFFKKISRFMEVKKNTDKELSAGKADAAFGHFTKPPLVDFRDRQTSRGSGAEAGSTSVHSRQARRRSPNRSVHSGERLPSGLLKGFRVSGEDSAGDRAHLSDDISGSSNSPGGCNVSDKHERTMAALPSVAAVSGVPFGSGDEQRPSPAVTLAKMSMAPCSVALMAAESSAEEAAPPHTDYDLEPQTLGSEPQHAAGRRESVSAPSSDVLSESSVSDLSISLTQSEDEDLPEGVVPERNATFGGSADPSLHSDGSSCESSPPAVTSGSLSQEGLFHLLGSVEGRLHGGRTGVYTSGSVDGGRLHRIISLCNGGAGLNEEDLEACGAVILHGLQRLSWSTAKGCLLPQDLERRVLSAERLVQLFTPLLLERHATYSHQAKVLLRTLVSRSSEECPSAEDESDSSPSPPADGDVKPAASAQEQHIQELQSSEEDSRDESPVESVPIRETKAYQLLKQSAMLERLQSSEEEEDDGLSGINHGREEDLGRAKRSSHQDPYPRKESANPKTHSAAQFKDLWGDSDDGDSDIEAALRPQPFKTNTEDSCG